MIDILANTLAMNAFDLSEKRDEMRLVFLVKSFELAEGLSLHEAERQAHDAYPRMSQRECEAIQPASHDLREEPERYGIV